MAPAAITVSGRGDYQALLGLFILATDIIRRRELVR
jgi:hypothetical protein